MDNLRIANIIDETEAEGPGTRTAIWVQGCTIRCPNCCNPEMFEKTGGQEYTIENLYSRLAVNKIKYNIEGITILGGEPFEQAAGNAGLCQAAKDLGLTVMVFSGYVLDKIKARGYDADLFLSYIDLLVDGPYNHKLPEPPPPKGRRWIGSSNQIMHYLTNAYSESDPRMRAPNTIEIRLNRKGLVVVNGWPTADKLKEIE
jgi:anaerobic ribonucleoside-triphosphate reductase activating protein